MTPFPRWAGTLAAGGLVLLSFGCRRNRGDDITGSSGSLAAGGPDAGVAADVAPQVVPAGLVALDPGTDSIVIGPSASVDTDTALCNGGVHLQPLAVLSGPVNARGSVLLEPRARVVGDVTAGGDVRRLPGAVITGVVAEHAAVPFLAFPDAEALAATFAGGFGAAAPDIRVASHHRATLAPGARRVRRLDLEPSAELEVTGTVNLMVTDAVDIDPNARIIVKDGGQLALYAKGTVTVGPGGGIVQSGQNAARGLTLIAAPTTQATFAPDSRFGPGLLYAPDGPTPGHGGHAVQTINDFDGSLIVQRVRTQAHARLQLSGRYLRCAMDVAPPTVVITSPSGTAATVPFGARTISLAGTATDDAGVESLTLTDVAGTHALTVGANGAFQADAALRTDGEPTTVCVAARDCAGRSDESCVRVTIASPIDFAITSPVAGQIVSAGTVNVQGVVLRGTIASIAAGGITGQVAGATFGIPRVPLAPGNNVIVVTASDGAGNAVVHRVLVTVQQTPTVVPLTVEIGVGDRTVAVKRRDPAQTVSRLPSGAGRFRFRVLDAAGAQVYEGPIGGTAERITEFTGDDGAPHTAPLPDQPYTAVALVPVLAGAHSIEFLSQAGQVVGRTSLP